MRGCAWAAHVDQLEHLVDSEALAHGARAAVREPVEAQLERFEVLRLLERVAQVSPAARADGIPAQVELGHERVGERSGDGTHAVVAHVVVGQHEAAQRGGHASLQQLLRHRPRADVANAARGDVERGERRVSCDRRNEREKSGRLERRAMQSNRLQQRRVAQRRGERHNLLWQQQVGAHVLGARDHAGAREIERGAIGEVECAPIERHVVVAL